jgi:hypothetical protein
VTDDGAVNATLTTNDKCSLHIIFFSSGNLFFVSCHLKTFSRMNHVSVISLLLSCISIYTILNFCCSILHAFMHC